MALSRGERLAIFLAFWAALLSGILNVGIREWYSPDIRYEEGSYYIALGPAIAITSLKIKNFGHSDAEDLNLIARFNRLILDISVGDNAVLLEIISGGKGSAAVSGRILRLVPGQEIFVYFSLENPSSATDELRKDFLHQITFKGGKGKAGTPGLGMGIFLGLIIGFIIGPLFIMIFRRIDRAANKVATEEVLKQREKLIDEIILRGEDMKKAKESGYGTSRLE